MRTCTLIVATALVLGAITARADEQKSLSATSVVERYIDALGGREAIARCKMRHVQGTFAQGGTTGSLDLYGAEPDDYRLRLTLAGIGTFEEGVIGGVGWNHDDMSGARLMEGDHLASTVLRNRHNPELHYFDLYDEVVLEGEAEFDGVACYRLRLAAPWGDTFEYFDKETGLARGTESEMFMGGGVKVAMTVTVQEYAAFDGRLYAVKTTQESPMGSQTIVITDVDHSFLEADTFVPPAAVRALMKTE